MAKFFRPSNRESTIISKIESSKDYERRRSISKIKECLEPLANSISMKLVENELIETTSKDALEQQIVKCLETLVKSNDFDITYMVAPFRDTVERPHIVSLYVTAFVIERLIKHKAIIDIFGADQDIYKCINKQVLKHLSNK